MEELTKLLTKIELTADDIIDSKQQIVNLNRQQHETREALRRLKDLKDTRPHYPNKHWICVGDMFVRLNYNESRNLIADDQYHLSTGIEKLEGEVREKVEQLRELEGRPVISGFNLKPLKKEEILSLRTAFKI